MLRPTRGQETTRNDLKEEEVAALWFIGIVQPKKTELCLEISSHFSFHFRPVLEKHFTHL